MYSYYITPEEYEIAERNGINKNALEKRVRVYYWDKERAISEPLQKRSNYGEWPKIAKQNGIPDSTFKSRIHDLGWSPEKAATYPHQSRSESIKRIIEKHRVYPEDLLEKARVNGIGKRSFYQRIKKLGWEMERAATHPLNKTGRPRTVNA